MSICLDPGYFLTLVCRDSSKFINRKLTFIKLQLILYIFYHIFVVHEIAVVSMVTIIFSNLIVYFPFTLSRAA